MFPLHQRQLIRGCAAHVAANLGCGADYVAKYVNLYAPFSGYLQAYSGAEGGNWLRLTRSNGDKIEFAHLSKYIKKTGEVKEGQHIAVTGNTGQVTTGPHLHVQIINKAGKWLDPEAYTWTSVYTQKVFILKSNLTTLTDQFLADSLHYAQDWFTRTTNGGFLIDFSGGAIYGQFHSEHGVNTNGEPVIVVDWDEILTLSMPDITSLFYDPAFVIPDQPIWNFANHLNGQAMTQIVMPPIQGNVKDKASLIVHEWLHAWYFILRSKGISVVDDVHQYSGIDMPNPAEDYKNIVMKLKPHWHLLVGQQGEPMLIIHKKSDPQTKFALSSDAKIGFADFPAYQKFTEGRTVTNIELSDAEFNKIPTSQAVIKT